jgi:hypothetical protein
MIPGVETAPPTTMPAAAAIAENSIHLADPQLRPQELAGGIGARQARRLAFGVIGHDGIILTGIWR